MEKWKDGRLVIVMVVEKHVQRIIQLCVLKKMTVRPGMIIAVNILYNAVKIIMVNIIFVSLYTFIFILILLAETCSFYNMFGGFKSIWSKKNSFWEY